MSRRYIKGDLEQSSLSNWKILTGSRLCIKPIHNYESNHQEAYNFKIKGTTFSRKVLKSY